jgi:hypothetical protein
MPKVIDMIVDHLGRLAEVFLDRQHVRVDAAEQEAAVVGKGAELDQIVAALAIEGGRVAGVGALVLDLEQLAGVAEGPAMERAGEARLVALLEAAQHCAAMRAGVGQRVELAVLAARDDHRLPADEHRQEIIDIGDLAFVRQIDPVALVDVLQLELEQLLIGKCGAIQAIEMLLRIVLQQRFEPGKVGRVVLVNLDHAGLLVGSRKRGRVVLRRPRCKWLVPPAAWVSSAYRVPTSSRSLHGQAASLGDA